ncbi:MAG TPA: DUF4142 domain-containing protein [Pyrinomonadaceae bacterium]|jgi:putative membrane protein|nr:DUF4142 domain-containing protein [Pyrinomonadaceae bacterium]
MKRRVINGAALIAATVAMCGLGIMIPAAARSQNSNQSGDTNQGSGQRMSLNSMDTKFMMMAAQGGMAEVAMGRLAAERASSDDVKRYAQRMVEDHTRANEELMQLAATKGVTLPTAPDAKHQAMLTKMGTMTGAAFDREYLKNAGVKDHEKMQKLFTDESNKGTDPEVKAFAAKTLPVVQMHLSMARDMLKGTGGSNMKM